MRDKWDTGTTKRGAGIYLRIHKFETQRILRFPKKEI